MASKVTSSSNRSKRSSSKPVTQGQNPQRANRQKVASKLTTRSGSSAVGSPTGSGRTTYSDDRGKSTKGTAQRQYQQSRNITRPDVTQGRGGSSTPPKALPPSSKGGALATQGRGSLRGQAQLPPGRKGGGMEKAGPTIDVKANTPKVGSGKTTGNGGGRPALPPGKSGGALTKAAETAGKGRSGGVTQALIGIQAGRALGNAIGGAYKKAIRNEQAVRMSADGGRYVPGSQQMSTPAPAKTPAKPKPATKPAAASPASRPSAAPAPSRRASGGSASRSTPRPVPKTASGTAGKGQQWADFNPNRGTSKTNNPLIKKDDWMMQRMKDREATQQSEAAQKVGNKFDSSSDLYTPSTKVDGSNLDANKIDQKKVNEYDRRKRRYYS